MKLNADFDWKPLALVPALALLALPAVGSPSTWITLTVAGLAMGMIVFIIASGLTLVFGLMDVLNFGHGVFIALGAFVATTVLASMTSYTQADSLWPKLLAKLDARGLGQRKVLIEPGRSLVGNAGACVTEVLYLKPGEQKNFCIVDAAMNDLPRPAMYQAHHGIVPVRPRSAEASTVWEVVGPVCESGDWLGHDRSLAVHGGDLLAVLSAGAYCMSMASNYNSRGRAAEILVSGSTARLIRTRETLQDQLRNEQALAGL